MWVRRNAYGVWLRNLKPRDYSGRKREGGRIKIGIDFE
jgi:hypothetical protein